MPAISSDRIFSSVNLKYESSIEDTSGILKLCNYSAER